MRTYHVHCDKTFLSLLHNTYPIRVTMSQTFSTPPPATTDVQLSSPSPHILLVTLNRPSQLNALRREHHAALDRLWRWYDEEPQLRCAVITGKGRAFCAGADLKEWFENNKNGKAKTDEKAWDENGFGGMSNRRGKKPIIAAVNGLCLGGGMEMILNADMVLASSSSGVKFGLPEVTIGVVAVAGALPRLIRTVGRPRATEMALLGKMYAAQDMLSWGVINAIVEGDGLVTEALEWADRLAGNSPDAVIVSREGLMGGWDGEDPRASTERVDHGVYRKMEGGENMREGVGSFAEKRKAVWKNSKL